MNIIIQLAFLSYYRYSFFLMDVVLFVWICFGYYHLTYKILPLFTPDSKKNKFDRVRNILSICLGVQMFCSLFLLCAIVLQKTPMVHFRSNAGVSGFLFVVLVIFRVINIVMVSSFLASCWMFLPTQDKIPYLTRWFLLMAALLLYSLGTLFYMLFPSMNKALDIYQLFYNIRNLYLVDTADKKYNTFLYLQQFGCIPPSYMDLYQHEWKRTFHNPVMVPLECAP